MKIIKKFLSLMIVLCVISCVSFGVCAYSIPSFSENGRIMSIAHGGDCPAYPENSISAVTSAFKLGADIVSLPAVKAADGAFFVSNYDDLGETWSAYSGIVISQMTGEEFIAKSVRLTDKNGDLCDEKVCSLSELAHIAKAYGRAIIVDTPWENRNELYSYLVDNNLVENTILRTNANKKDIAEFLRITNGSLCVLGVYNGNVIMNARGYVSFLIKNGCKAVQLGTKNPFGVIFNKTMLSAFSPDGYATRAVISACDPYSCGQRSDSEEGWNEFIDRGYSVIETRNIKALTQYIDRTQGLRDSLTELLNSTANVNASVFTEKSLKNINGKRNAAIDSLKTLSSLNTLEKAESELIFALQDRKSDEDSTAGKGILNITAGKIAAVVIVGAGIFLAQVFFFKTQGDKKRKQTDIV